jgi:hypothetical protein
MFGLRTSPPRPTAPSASEVDDSDARAPAASLACVPVRGTRPAAKPAGKRDLYAGVLGSPAALPVAGVPAVGEQRRAEELVQYWGILCAGRALPTPLDLDRSRVALGWKNSGLLSYVADGGASDDPVPRALPLAEQGANAEDPLYIPLAPNVVAWLLGLAERTLRLARPVRETARLADGSFEALLLPFSLAGRCATPID